jgi:tetratricopeptide (TPR) repeat protein
MPMKVLLSYSRKSSAWAARSLKEGLERRGADVFLDLENINSGRFETVILNEIGRRDHFVVLLTPDTCDRLGTSTNWVRRELERALELKKNVVPILLDDTRIESVSPAFPLKEQLLALNACPLSLALFNEATDTLFNRYLSNPTIEELEIKTAEEYFQSGLDAQKREDWVEAEKWYGRAVGLRRRPEYLLGLGAAKHNQDRDEEALSDLDAAIATDPFAYELMEAKFNLLQHLDRMKEAIDLYGGGWRRQAQNHAITLARRVLDRISKGDTFEQSLRSIPQLSFLYANMPGVNQVGASAATLFEHLDGELEDELRQAFKGWRSANEGNQDQ